MTDPVGTHQRLRAHDRFFLDQESPDSTMNVGALVIVDGDRPEAFIDDLRQVFAARIHLLPRLRQRLAEVPLSGAPPVWVDDQCFDLNTRIRNLDVKSLPDRGDIVALAGRLVAEPLDRAGPLWDVSVVPRIADGKSAMLIRWHHALIDGMSGVEIAKLIFSTSRTTRHDAPQPWEPEQVVDQQELVAEAMAMRAHDLFRAAAEKVVAWAEPDHKTSSRLEFADGLWSLLKMGSLPPNPFPPRTKGARRYATTEVDEATLRSISRRFEVSVEVAVLAIVAGATNRMLTARGTTLDTVRVFVPRMVPSRTRAETLGNIATFNVVDLPIGAMTDSDRMHQVAASVESARESHQAEAVTAWFGSAERAPPAMSRAVAQWISGQTFVHTVVSYMRGPRRPLYLAGRTHLGTYPILPRTNGIGLLVGVLSLGGITTFGLVADPRGVPELEFFAAALRNLSLELADGF